MYRKLTDLPKIVYHGTTTEYLFSLDKINVSRGNLFVDNGQGFYTTSNYQQALAFARWKTNVYMKFQIRNAKIIMPNVVKPLVMAYNVNIDYLSQKFNGKVFEVPDVSWAEFVYNNRIGNDQIVSAFHNWSQSYDYVYNHIGDSGIIDLIASARMGEITFKDFCQRVKPNRGQTDDQLSFHSNNVIKCLIPKGGAIEHDFTYQEKRGTN